MANARPLVQAACLCENVLTEPDNVASLIRLIDTIYIVKPPEMGEGQVGTLQIRVYVSLKSGDVKGEYDIELVVRSPAGKTAKIPNKWRALFLGEQSGSSLTMNLVIPVTEMGLYWIDLIWEGESLTSIPFRLVEGQKPERPEDATKTTPV